MDNFETPSGLLGHYRQIKNHPKKIKHEQKSPPEKAEVDSISMRKALQEISKASGGDPRKAEQRLMQTYWKQQESGRREFFHPKTVRCSGDVVEPLCIVFPEGSKASIDLRRREIDLTEYSLRKDQDKLPPRSNLSPSDVSSYEEEDALVDGISQCGLCLNESQIYPWEASRFSNYSSAATSFQDLSGLSSVPGLDYRGKLVQVKRNTDLPISIMQGPKSGSRSPEAEIHENSN